MAAEPGLRPPATLARRVDGAKDRLRALRDALAGEEPIDPERVLLLLVAAARDAETGRRRSLRQVRRAARRRRRRLGVMSFAAGPLAGVAGQLVDLYCETAIVCDVADAHALELSDEQLAAHMLVLWSVTDTLDEADRTLAGTGRPLREVLTSRLRTQLGGERSEALTMRSAVKAISDARSLGGQVGRRLGARSVGGALFPGRRTRKAIRRARRQLGLVA